MSKNEGSQKRSAVDGSTLSVLNSPLLLHPLPLLCEFCLYQLCELQSEVAQVKFNLVSLESSFNCSISPLVRSEFNSLHESLCDISSNLISCLCLLLKQPLTSQMLIYNLHSLWLLLIFLSGLSIQKTSFATALPSYPPKSPSPSLIPKQQPASSPTSSSSLPASNPVSPSTSPSYLIISKWPASSPSSPSSLSPSSDYLSSSPSFPPPFPHMLLFLDKATPVCEVFLNV